MKNLEHNSSTIQEISKDIIIDYLDAFGLTNSLDENEKKQFIDIAFQYKLNPFKREIYCIIYGEGDYRKVSIIVGYETYIKRAERTGKLDGWKISVEGNGKDMKAIIIIYRKDWKEPFQHEVYFEEAVQKRRDGEITKFWKKQPKFQLKKVAISQGFRLCFPDELGGLPYDFSEVQEEINQDNIKIPDEDKNKLDSTYDLTSNNNEEIKAITQKIEDFLVDNESIFPAAHFKWIKKQLESNLDYEKLENIYEHVNAFKNNIADKQKESADKKDEVLIS